MAAPGPAARGVYIPRQPEASPLVRLVSDHRHRRRTVYDERFAREFGPWRSVVGDVADQFLACGVLERGLVAHSWWAPMSTMWPGFEKWKNEPRDVAIRKRMNLE